MIAIFKREVTSLFRGVIGWLFVAVFIALYSLYFTLNNLMYGAPSISYNLSAITLLFFIAIPILSMRIFAEDRKNKTDQLWMTAPVSVYEVVLGKFSALVFCLCIPTVFMALTPILLSLFGKVNYVQGYVALLGFVLYGITCIAIALFISALTESQVIAAVVSFAFLFLGFWMNNLVDALFPDGGIIADLLKCYDFATPMDEFAAGTISLVGVVYYISICLLFLFLTVQVIEKRRWSVSARKISGTVFSTSAVVLAIAVAVLINVGMPKLPSSYTTFDMTKKKLYSMTPQAVKYIKSIDEDVTIYCIGTQAEVKQAMPELVSTLRKAKENSGHIKVKYVDISKNPGFVAEKTGGESELYTGSMIVESGKRNRVISSDVVYETEVDYETYSQNTTGYDGEGQLISAMQYVLTEKMPVAYVLTGHDEIALEGGFVTTLEKKNIEQKDLNLLKEEKVPKDASMVIVNAPQSDISKEDLKMLNNYVKNGGKLFVSLEFSHISGMKNLKKLLDNYKIEVVDGIVADKDGDHHFQSPYYLLPTVETSDVTSEIAGEAMVFSPFTVGLKVPENSGDKAKITYTPLLSTSKKAFSKTTFASDAEMTNEMMDPAEKVKKEDGDIKGPFTVGVQANIKDAGSLMVFGSSYIFTSSADGMVAGHNVKLFDGVLTAFTADSEEATANSGLTIPVKKYEDDRLTVPAGALRIYAPLFILGIPLLCVITGVFIFFLRRRR